jgi:hypothetical protein
LGTYKPGEWNPYSEIKRKLVEDHNIPAHEIRFIQEAKTEVARKAMIKAMNEGNIRILFGKYGNAWNGRKRPAKSRSRSSFGFALETVRLGTARRQGNS